MIEYDQDFIKEEYRSGWLVTTLVKKSWWIQLDVLKEFARVCKENGLRWYPIGGILIGVIRHKGFIPWDDDIDIAMPREDYDKLEEACKKSLKYPYEFQSTFTDPDCFMFWSSIRNSETTGNRVTCLSKRLNNGIGIDILPLEGCEDNYYFYKLRRLPLRIASVICNTYVNEFNNTTKARMLRSVLRKFKINYRSIYRWVEKHNSKHPMSKYNKCTLTLIADPIVQTKEGLRRVIWDKADFESTIMMPFENTEIPVPAGYDHILTTEYHNYMEFPPIEKRKGKHDIVLEPDIPYKEYCSKNYGVVYDKE
ncbi:MAG: LicD family protein [Clostridia bacterium]|nr:LicD family protein [Clostridia bacterium]